MNNDWREELIKKVATAIAVYAKDDEDDWWIWEPEARAALAVAEPVIREQCAKMAEKSLGTWGAANALYISAAIREGGNDE